ncbi:MAG: O-6-methylguanine DNA methyltransferase [Lentimonas sp.]|jgi:O-6-methylguanine DNA methyltransferase
MLDTDYFLKTRWGTLRASFGSNGLNRFVFEDCSSQRLRKDDSFRDTFMHWLSDFQNSSIDKKWGKLSLKGTDFQRQVWRALLEIPLGSQVNYNTIATRIGRPNANRAVGSAVGANPITVLIPCHRVVPASGGTGNYRWGSERKQSLLEMENSHGIDLITLFQNA